MLVADSQLIFSILFLLVFALLILHSLICSHFHLICHRSRRHLMPDPLAFAPTSYPLRTASHRCALWSVIRTCRLYRNHTICHRRGNRPPPHAIRQERPKNFSSSSMRSFSTVSKVLFNKKPSTAYNLINNAVGSASEAAMGAGSAVENHDVSLSRRWRPTHGNSFRTFAEYRLKVVHQLPLTKAKVGGA